jgi:hypothetical protein
VFELLSETRDNLIAVRMSETISAVDYERFMPDVEDRIARVAPAVIFVDWERFEGWSSDSRWYSFWYRVTNRRAFTRVAVIASEAWRDEIDQIAKILDRADVRRFEPAKRADAFAWLRDATIRPEDQQRFAAG